MTWIILKRFKIVINGRTDKLDTSTERCKIARLGTGQTDRQVNG